MSLRVAGLTVRAGGRALVDGVDLVAGAGRVTGLVGPNGAGKSTLLRAVLGLVKPDAGAITFAGEDLLALPRRQRARLMAHVAQDSTTEARLTARDVVLLGRIPFQSVWQSEPSAADRAIADAALAEVGMADFADRAFHTLSGGEQQRLHIARALAQQPRLLVLDEPTNHLDIEAQLAVLALLRARAAAGLTVLLVLHDLTLAAGFCDELAVLHRGRLVAQGVPDAVLTPALLRAVYNVEALLVPHPMTGRPILAYPA